MPFPQLWTREELLGLALVPRVKSVDIRRIVGEFSSLDEALDSSPVELQKAGILSDAQHQTGLFRTTLRTELLREAEKQLEICHAQGIDIVTFWDEAYPASLKEIYYPPAVLYVRGMLQAPDAVAISIVGTRHCTDYGRLAAEQYAEHFAQAGIIVVSGLAMGIDTIAHKAVLNVSGITYAVIASGIDKITSFVADKIAREISEFGAVISEYPSGTPALPAYFPRRNRIISGLAQATVVVESGERGGSLITAQFALDQNRELFAIPGRIFSERSKGTNALIQRSQAQLTMSPHDVLQALGLAKSASKTVSQAAQTLNAHEHISEEARRVLEALHNGDPLQIDLLAEHSNIAVQDLHVVLLELEFQGLVRQLAGKQFVRV